MSDCRKFIVMTPEDHATIRDEAILHGVSAPACEVQAERVVQVLMVAILEMMDLAKGPPTIEHAAALVGVVERMFRGEA